MAAETVEIVRRIYEEVSANLRLPDEPFAPDCVTDWTQVAPDFGVAHGIVATNRALSAYFDTFDDYHVEADEILHADENRVVASVRDGGRISGSEGEVSNRFFHAWTFRDGKVIRLSSHHDRASAFAAARLT